MIQIEHWTMMTLYALLPIAAAVYAAAHLRRGRLAPAGDLVLTLFVGTLLGTAGVTLYAMLVGGRVQPGQLALTIYFSSAVMLMLKSLDWIVRTGMRRLKRKRNSLTTAIARGVVLVGVGLPFVLAGAVTYRPKVLPRGDPQSLLGFDFSSVAFDSTDGVHLSGWWIPSTSRRRPSDRTVIVCHGLAANKSTQLVLIRRLVPAGYNALVFDLRAHGESGGQFTGLGDLERRDVLGAVKWLKANHSQQTDRIYGLGVNIGGAALIAAAIDPGDDGQSIDAIAVYGAFDDLDSLAADFTGRTILPPLAWTTRQIGLPLASMNAGVNLGHFNPGELVRELWPRPILVIHGTRDRVVPFDDGKALFDAASFPKRFFWLTGKDQDQTLGDDDAAAAVRDFFDSAEPMPMI